MEKKKISYEDAFNELQEIAKALENNQLPVNELTLKVERAAELMEYCKSNLRSVEKKLDDLFEEIE